MAEETHDNVQNLKVTGDDVYKQVAPSGLASEITADNPVAPETVAALGRWLAQTLPAEARERVATLSGISQGDLASLLEGHPLFRLDTDHLQRLATALVEAQVIPHADALWQAIGFEADSSDYLVPPTQIVQAMSGG